MTKAGIPWNARQLSTAFDNGSLRFDNALQRAFVWDKKRMSLLIDSIFRGYPIPPVFLIRGEDKVQTKKGLVSVYDCIDGKQRCTTINSFRNNGFVLEGLEPFSTEDGTEVDLNGKTYDELDKEFQVIFDSYGLNIYYFTDVTDDEISEMMSRLNNGKALTGVENARIKAKALNSIIKLANHEVFKENLTEAAIKGYSNEDIVIKTYMQAYENNFELSSKNVKSVYETHIFTEKEKAELTASFDAAYGIINTIKENSVKKIQRKVLSKTNFVAIITLAFKFSRIENVDWDDVALSIKEFFTTEDNNVSVSENYNTGMLNGTNHSGNVILRNDALEAHCKPVKYNQ